ncbi:MAG: nucleotide pyrophosphohydrolase, partial [Bdellovibrionales bacterium]
DELADSLYFLLRFAQLYNFDLSESLRRKMEKNAIKYPVP